MSAESEEKYVAKYWQAAAKLGFSKSSLVAARVVSQIFDAHESNGSRMAENYE